MTTRDRSDLPSPEFDRRMAVWFDTESRVRRPDELLDRTLARTALTRPLPTWRLAERWLPMELTIRRQGLPRTAPYIALMVILVLGAAIALTVVGSRPRVLAPFGLAANGSIATVDDGAVAILDPTTGETQVVWEGRGDARLPTFSRDGTRLAFIVPADTPENGVTDVIMAVDATGGHLVRLTYDRLAAPWSLTWSPDGSTVAFADEGRLLLAEADGSGARSVDLGVTLDGELAWRPPDGQEIVFRGVDGGRAALFLAEADGSEPRPITPVDGGQNSYLWVTWSPDGQRLAYSTNNAQETHVLTIDGPDVEIRPVNGRPIGFPRFSPDGRQLAVMAWHPTGGTNVQVGVFAADDATPVLTQTGPVFSAGIQFDWSPDGTAILVDQWDTDQPWLLDPEGGEGTPTPWRMTIPDWVEWQRLAR